MICFLVKHRTALYVSKDPFHVIRSTVGWCKLVSVMEDRNIMLNSVHQHNGFITQGNYIGYMFRLLISHLQAYFCHLSHKMLCALWDPIVFTSMEYIKLNNLSQRV